MAQESPAHSVALEFGWLVVNNLENVIKTISRHAPRKGFAQAFGLQYVASAEQIAHAALQAMQGVSFSHQPELDFLQRLVGEKQLRPALQLAGLKEGNQAVGLVAVSSNAADSRKKLSQLAKILKLQKKRKLLDAVFSQSQRKIQQHYGVTEKQLRALSDLGSRKKALQAAVLEKAALVSLEE